MEHRKYNRLLGYDYSQNGYYFVTVCTYNRIEWLGKIENDRMILNECCQVILECWHDIPNHYRNVKLDESVVMPNHIHGVIVISDAVGTEQCSVPTEPKKRFVLKRKNGAGIMWKKCGQIYAF